MRNIFLLAALLATVGGCGPGGPVRVPVSGTVSYDGKPVEMGDILFLDPAGRYPPDGVPITNGRYEVKVSVGPKRVEIRDRRQVPGTADPMRGGRPDEVEYIPAQYNRSSTLTVEVKEGGPNTFDFPLERGKK